MKGVVMDVPFQQKASRIELLIRPVYYLIGVIVYVFVGMLASIAWPLQILHILVLGKRQGLLQRINQMFLRWHTEFIVYLFTVTDERPPLIPKW